MSPDRRRLLAALAAAAGAAALAGCGYRPAMGTSGPARGLWGRTRVSAPRGRIGFALAESLHERLGRPEAGADHQLVADVTLTESGVAITADAAVTRFVLRGESRWRLTGPLADPEGLEGVAESTSAYSATASLFATRAARRDAETRVARDLGIRIASAAFAALEARGA